MDDSDEWQGLGKFEQTARRDDNDYIYTYMQIYLLLAYKPLWVI